MRQQGRREEEDVRLLVEGEGELTLGWPGGEVKVMRKKIQIAFLPLMALRNESPKKF